MIQLPKHRIDVDVKYYDDNEGSHFQTYPSFQKLEQMVQSPIQISPAEFLTHYLFYRKRPGKSGYRNYHELSFHITEAFNDLKDWITFNEHSICSAQDVDYQDNHITERVGEAIGLSVINQVHGLTSADWDRIPPAKGGSGIKIFDYQIASDGNNTIQIETKGACVKNNSLKPSGISNHKSSIKTKKISINQKEAIGQYPYPASLRYGTISAISDNPNSVVKCWLVDPEPGQKIPPLKLKLLNRMHFILDYLTFVSPRSQLTSALSSRLDALANMEDPFTLNKVPLSKGSDNPFFYQYDYNNSGHSTSFFASRSHVTDGPAGGVITQISDREIFFLGFFEELIQLAIDQDFDEITAYKHEGGLIEKQVRCLVGERHYREMRLPAGVKVHKYGSYYDFTLEGPLYYSPEGLVFGILHIE